MTSIQALRERRRALVDSMNAMLEQHAGEQWTTALQARWDESLREIDGIDARLARAQDALARLSGVSGAPGELSTLRAADGRIVPVFGPADRFIDHLGVGQADARATGLGDVVRRAIAMGQQSVQASLGEGADATGGVTVPTRLVQEIIDAMRARTVAIRAGARTIPLETLETSFAKLTTDPTAAWRNENAAVAESDPAFARVKFTARSLACEFKVSRELIDDAINLDEVLMTAIAGSFAVKLDAICLTGSGSAPEPRGIVNTSGIGSVSMGVNGATLANYAKVLDAVYEVEVDNAGPVSALVMAPRTWRAIQGFADTTGQPLMPPPAIAALPQLLTTSMPITETQGTSTDCSTIIAGRFSDLWIGVRQDLRIEILRERASANMQYIFQASLRADVQLARAEAFAKLIGIRP